MDEEGNQNVRRRKREHLVEQVEMMGSLAGVYKGLRLSWSH